MTIVATLVADERSRTPDRSCYWIAECTVGGQRYAARSRHGAAYALARVLVAAGVPDAPMAVGGIRFRSFHRAALYTLTETAGEPIRRIPYRDPASRYIKPKIEGGTGCPVPEQGSDLSHVQREQIRSAADD